MEQYQAHRSMTIIHLARRSSKFSLLGSACVAVIAMLQTNGIYTMSVGLLVVIYFGIPLFFCVVVVIRLFQHRFSLIPARIWLKRAVFFGLLLCAQAILATMYHTSNDLFLNVAFLFAFGLSVSCYQYRNSPAR